MSQFLRKCIPRRRDLLCASGLLLLPGVAAAVIEVHRWLAFVLAVTLSGAVAAVLYAVEERRQRGAAAEAKLFQEIQRAGEFSAFIWGGGEQRVRWSRLPEVLRGLVDDRPFPQWRRFLHPQDRTPAGRAFDDLAETPGECDLEFRVIAADGSCHWFALRATALRRQTGRLMVGALIDLTVHCKTEELVREMALEVALNDLAVVLGEHIRNSIESLSKTLYLLQHDLSLQQPMKEYLLDTATIELERLGRISNNVLGINGEPQPAGRDDHCDPTFPVELGRYA